MLHLFEHVFLEPVYHPLETGQIYHQISNGTSHVNCYDKYILLKMNTFYSRLCIKNGGFTFKFAIQNGLKEGLI